jgi:hypothetical protein
MTKVANDVLGAVLEWLEDPERTVLGRPHTPGKHRLATQCLAPLIQEFVDPTPLTSHRQRIHSLLDAAEPSLSEDLQAASEQVSEVLGIITGLGLGAPAGRLLVADDIQNRVAAHLRAVLATEWREALDPTTAAAPEFKPAWTTHQEALTHSLMATAEARRCKAWAIQAEAGSAADLGREWGDHVRDAEARRTQPESSVDAGLGDLEVPHLIHDPQQPRNWRLATDRSFLNRIRLYWHTNHRPSDLSHADPGASQPEVRFGSSTTPGEDLVRESVARTLAPLGLAKPAHQTFAAVAATALGQAADAPSARPAAPPLFETWEQVLAAKDPSSRRGDLTSSVVRHAAAKLRRDVEMANLGDLDARVVGICAARRVWIRLHAWEVVDSRIPAPALMTSLNSALTKSLTCEGAFRSKPVNPETSTQTQRLGNTQRMLARMYATSGIQDPEHICAEYRRLYGRNKKDPSIQGGIHSPAWVERALGCTGGPR